MSPSSSSKLSQLVSAIKSSDPVRTRALCDDITFDINDAVECDSDGEDDFPLQVALGKGLLLHIHMSPFRERKRARPFVSPRSLLPKLSRFLSLFTVEKEEKERKKREKEKQV